MSIKKFAVIGHPIGHTMSPFIHNRLFELSGIEAEYTKLDIAPENLADESAKYASGGYNITIPHKQNIIPLIDEIDEKAKMYGSVNTVANFDGVAKGYTTDPDGFLKALNAAGITLDGRVVILGCGGVARTMAYEVVLKGLPLLFAVRKEDVDTAKLLCNEIENIVKGARCFYLIDELGDIDVCKPNLECSRKLTFSLSAIQLSTGAQACRWLTIRLEPCLSKSACKRSKGCRRNVNACVAGSSCSRKMGRLGL